MKPDGVRGSSVSKVVSAAVMAAADRIFTQDDFGELPRTAVSLALSRLAKSGALSRIARGVYYRPRQTVVGASNPKRHAVELTLLQGARPTGLTAAALLGFSTQQPSTPTYAIPRRDEITRLKGIKVVRMRPDHDLSPEDGALLEFIRDRGKWSELGDKETIDRLKSLFKEKDRFNRLAEAAITEPPRVRAILGAVGELTHAPKPTIDRLRNSLNPTTRFDFGRLRSLPAAKSWNAK